MALHKLVAFKVSTWTPDDTELSLAFSLMQPDEATRAKRFVHLIDRKRAIVSHLLIRHLIGDMLGADALLTRTPEGRPIFAERPIKFLDFNASHHGDFVVCAASNTGLVGVDVTVVELPPSDSSVHTFFQYFKTQFTPHEWRTILAAERGVLNITGHPFPVGTDEGRLELFHWHWAMKEAYVKAKGTGLGMDLLQVEFHLHEHGKVQLYESGKLATAWTIQPLRLDLKHLMVVATAPISEASSSLARSLPLGDAARGDAGSWTITPIGVHELLKADQTEHK